MDIKYRSSDLMAYDVDASRWALYEESDKVVEDKLNQRYDVCMFLILEECIQLMQ